VAFEISIAKLEISNEPKKQTQLKQESEGKQEEVEKIQREEDK
jgi:hypothetical protein